MRVLAAVLLLISASAPGFANVSFQQDNQNLSANEEREVREFAARLAANLEKTRDLTPYLTKPHASDLFYKTVTDQGDSDGIVARDVASKVGNYQLRRFYIALLNIAYLSETYMYTRFRLEKTGLKDLLPHQKYPVHVVRFMERNPTLKQWWKNIASSDSENRVTTVAQFYSLLNTFNKAAVLMRAYFKRHPPERTAIYKQNVTYLGPFLNKIDADTCDTEQDCAGLPLRTQTITVNLPVVQLFLARLNGRLEVLIIGLHYD